MGAHFHPIHDEINNIRVRADMFFALVISKVFQVAHDAANLANRANPIMTDLILGCEDIGYDTVGLHRVEVATRKRKRGTLYSTNLMLHLHRANDLTYVRRTWRRNRHCTATSASAFSFSFA